MIAQKLIRAPFAGQLGMRQVELGQYLTPGAPIVTLTDLSMLYVNFTLPSQMRPQISVGQRVNVTADAYPGRTLQREDHDDRAASQRRYADDDKSRRR